MFSLRLVDSNTGLPARLSSQLLLCMIILNETISGDKSTDRSRYLVYSAMRTNDGVTIAFDQQAEWCTMMEPWKRLAPAHVIFKLLSRYWAPDILLFLDQVYSKCATEFILEQASYDGSTVILGGDNDSDSKEDDTAYCDFEFVGFEPKAKKKKDSDFDSDVHSMGSVYAVDPEKRTSGGENEDLFSLDTCACDIIAQACERLTVSLLAKTAEEVQEPPVAKVKNTGAPVTPTQKTYAQVLSSKCAGPRA